MQGVTDPGSAEASYYDWVDQFDTLGLGKNVPIATGNGNDALLALLPDSGKFVVLRVPYPMGFYEKGWTADRRSEGLVGREKVCGLPSALELLFTRKVVKERGQGLTFPASPRPPRALTLSATNAFLTCAKFRVVRYSTKTLMRQNMLFRTVP